MTTRTALSEHFDLEELIPAGWTEPVPTLVHESLTKLCATILEPVRAHLGTAIRIHSGWRPDGYNAAHGGVKASDHMLGRAADFHPDDQERDGWADEVRQAFEFIRVELDGLYGQLILEDHREALGSPGKLWVHVSIPSKKHTGSPSDPNRIITSPAPGVYLPWKGD